MHHCLCLPLSAVSEHFYAIFNFAHFEITLRSLPDFVGAANTERQSITIPAQRFYAMERHGRFTLSIENCQAGSGINFVNSIPARSRPVRRQSDTLKKHQNRKSIYALFSPAALARGTGIRWPVDMRTNVGFKAAICSKLII